MKYDERNPPTSKREEEEVVEEEVEDSENPSQGGTRKARAN